MIARIFAETGVADLYKGILRLLVQHKDETRRRIVRLRGEYIPVDPDKWDATMDVRVNVALGTGLIEDKIQTLQVILEKQEGLMSAGAPIIKWRGIRTTLSKLVELGGWPTADEFFEIWGPQEQQAFDQQQAEAGAQPDAEMLLVQVEAERVANEKERAEAQLIFDREELTLKDDRERDKVARQFAVDSERVRLEGAYKTAEAVMKASVESDRASQDRDLGAAKLLFEESRKRDEDERARAEAEAAALAGQQQ